MRIRSVDAPQAVTETSARLAGSVRNTITGPTVYWFDYGPGTAYGSSTPHRSTDITDVAQSLPVSEPGGVRLIVSAPARVHERSEWLGLELETTEPESTRARLHAFGIAVSDVYDTDGGSRAMIVTTPNGQKFRVGTRWPLPERDADLTGGPPPKERGLS